jgi:hypothetical protein
VQSRIIRLPQEFIDYLGEDGIILADDDGEQEDEDWTPSAPSARAPTPDEEDASDSEDERPPRLPPNKRFPALHQKIKDEIQASGGAVAPKLNWSSPKDATFMSRHKNTVRCSEPNDVYVLLKSSSFVSHDLSHAFDGCVESATPAPAGLGFKPVLILRTYFDIRTPLEFRCFVKHRNLVAITPRDLKYYDFLDRYRPAIIARAKELFDGRLKYTFPDGNFVFDVYIPESDQRNGLARARLIDINPWAPRTDTLLFSWRELLDLYVPHPILGVIKDSGFEFDDGPEEEDGEDESSDEEDDTDFEPELRLVEEEDAAAYNLASPEYSAHKLPKDVVDASSGDGAGLREILQEAYQRGFGREQPSRQ